MSRGASGRRTDRRRGCLHALGGLAVVAVTLASCAAPGVSAPPAPPAARVTIPLASATVASGGWASVAMGHLGDPSNTFWELFHLAGAVVHWSLVTPPGVASNGGLVLAPGPGGSLAAGFEPTDLLHFSPLARTAAGGASWSAGTAPGELASVPDALAAAGPGYVALLRSGLGTVVSNGGDLNTWTPVASLDGSAPPGCDPTGATAVAALADGSPEVGLECVRGRQAAILLDRGGRWLPVGPALPPVAGAGTEVLRLVGTGGGVAALIRAGGQRHGALYAAWSADGSSTWSVSPPLTTGAVSLVATGTTPAGGFVVTSAAPAGGRSAAVIDPGAAAWRTLAAPPSRTAVVAALPGGGFDALAVDHSTLGVSTLEGRGWTLQARVAVPIQYGSSG